VRPLLVRTDDDIDDQNAQAYHGRETTTTNEARPAVWGSRLGERRWTQRERRRRVASRVRSRPRTAGRTRVLRARTEAAVANDPMRCRT
jgi:hypothetical protein